MNKALKAAILASDVLSGFNSVQKRMIMAALAVGVRAAESNPDEPATLVFARQLKNTQKVKINLSDSEGTLEVSR